MHRSFKLVHILSPCRKLILDAEKTSPKLASRGVDAMGHFGFHKQRVLLFSTVFSSSESPRTLALNIPSRHEIHCAQVESNR